MPAIRPGPLRWLWYALGGRVPERYREWVLADLSCGTWVLRHVGRVLVIQPMWLLFLLVPAPWSLRWSGFALACSLSVLLAVLFMEDACERRALRHGYPAGLARAIREQVPLRERRSAAALYAARYRGDARHQER